MLPLRVNNPLAPAVYNGLSSTGIDAQGRPYRDELFVKSFTLTLAANQTLTNQTVQLDRDADFNWLAVSVQDVPEPWAIRFHDSTGYRVNDSFIGSFAFRGGVRSQIGAPWLLPKPLLMPAGSAILFDIVDQSGPAALTNGPIQFLFIGLKRFYSTSQTEITYKQRINNSVDAWAINSALFPVEYSYQWQCVNAMNAVRAANNYRPKIYAVPDQSVFPQHANPIVTNPDNPGMLPFSDYTTQVRMVPGTIVVGMSLAVTNFGAPGAYDSNYFDRLANTYLNCTDDATGVPFFSDWMAEILFNVPVFWNGQVPAPPVQGVGAYTAVTSWLPLTRPRTVLSPGVVTVQMCFKSTPGGANEAPQLLLYCAEPCNVIRNTQECE